MNAEVWKPIPGFVGYDASDQGRIRSWWIWGKRVLGAVPRILKINNTGRYSTVCLCVGAKRFTKQVHALVLTAHRGACPPGHQGRHVLESDTRNNALSNLAWGTPKQNAADKERHGHVLRGAKHPSRKHIDKWARGDAHYARARPQLLARGEGHGCAKLTVPTVRAIFLDIRPHQQIADAYGAHKSTVSKIKRRAQWREATADLVTDNGNVRVA